jgi:uncharacterized protein (TIGR02611 family)
MAEPPDELLRTRLRDAALEAEYGTGDRETSEEHARRNIFVRIAIITVGLVLLLAGLVMMVLPGPGLVAILVGLGILAQEFTWADRLLKTVRKKARVDQVAQQPLWVRIGIGAISVAAVVAGIAYAINR